MANTEIIIMYKPKDSLLYKKLWIDDITKTVVKQEEFEGKELFAKVMILRLLGE